MAKRIGLAFLAFASVLILATLLVGGSAAAVAFACLAAAFPVALMAIGAARGGRLRSAAIPIGGLALVLGSSLVVMLGFAGGEAAGPGGASEAVWLWGLPVGLAAQIFGVFLIPLVVVTIGYALTFRDFGVSDDDLKRLRRIATER